MTKDFHYKGFTSPNGTVVPDDVFDVIAPELTEAELRVLLYVVRRTFGFKKNSDAISVGQMVSGIQTRDGRILDRGTGMSKSAVWRGAKGLVEKGIMQKTETKSDNGEYETNVYTLRFANEADSSLEIVEENKYEGVSLQKSNPYSPKELPPLSKRDTVTLQESTQETVKQQTEISHSNIRKSNSSNQHFVDNTTSQQISFGADRSTSRNGSGAPLGVEGVGAIMARVMPQTARDQGPKRGRGRPRKYQDQDSQTLLNYVSDFAREFSDNATLNQSATRMINLYQKWGRGDIDAFVGVLYQARSVTKAQNNIRTSKFAYFFSVVEDLLGLKEEQDAVSSSSV